MKRTLYALFLILTLLTIASDPAGAATAKLSAIASGGAINPATDTVVAVRNGTTDVLVTPPNGVSITSASPGITVSPSPGIDSIVLGVTSLINAQGTAASYTVLSSDMGKLVTHSKGTAVAESLPQCNNGSFTIGSSYSEMNFGAGTVTITVAAGAFNGSSTSSTTLALTQYQSAWLTCGADGNWNVFAGAGSAGGGSGTVSSSTSGQIAVYTGSTTVAGGAGLTASGGTLSLGTANTTLGSLVMYGNTSGSVTISPAAAAGSASYVWPATAGTNTYVLTTDGSGTLSWAAPSTTSSTITSSAAQSFSVGANGATNPVFNVDDSTASVVSGISVKGSATGVAPTITTTDSGSNSGLTIQTKGTGNLTLNAGSGGLGSVLIQANSSTIWQYLSGRFIFSPVSQSSTVTPFYSLNGATRATATASTEAPLATFGSTTASTDTHATGALTLNRSFIFTAENLAFSAGSTVTDGAGIGFTMPGCGANATCTNLSGIYHGAQALLATGTITNAYAINVAADTGATNNYAIRTVGKSQMDTIISGGTTFTVSGCSATSPVGGSAAGTFASGTTGACTAVVTINGATGATAPNGWSCWSNDETTGNLFRQTASSTTTATFSGTTVSGDAITFGCMGY